MPRLRHAADHHVRVATGLDLLQPVPVDEGVEVGVERVQEPDQLGGRRVAGPLRVSGDIGEQDRGVVVLVGDDVSRRILEPARDRRGQDVGQQRLGSLVLGLHRLFGAVDFAHRVPDRRHHHDRRADHRADETDGERPWRAETPVVGNEELEGDRPATPNATIVDARTMRSIPNTRTTRVADTRK